MIHRRPNTEDMMIGNIAGKAMEAILEKKIQTASTQDQTSAKRWKSADERSAEIEKFRQKNQKLNEDLARFIHGAEKGEYNTQLTFANLLLRMPYWQDIHVYVTNMHGENIPLYHGKKHDIDKKIYPGCKLLLHILDEVVVFRGLAAKNRENSIILQLKDENYERSIASTVPKYISSKWDRHDYKTRPYLLNTELDGDVLYYNQIQAERRSR